MYFVRTKKRGIGKEKKELAEEKKGNSWGKVDNLGIQRGTL
jgi:hypothetical protein